MRFASRLLLAAAIAAGSSAAASAQEQGQPLVVSSAYRAAITQARAAIQAGNHPAAETSLAAAAAAATNDYERYFVQALRLPTLVRHEAKDRIPVLDALIANTHTPASDRAYYTFLRGVAALEQKKAKDAIGYFVRARELGHADRDLTLQLARAYFDAKRAPEAIAEIDRAIQREKADNRKPPEDWYKLVVSKLYGSGDRATAQAWRVRQLADYPGPQSWRSAIVGYRETWGAGGARLDKALTLNLFRLQRASRTLADVADYVDYATLAQALTLPAEAVAVIEEGRAAGKLPAKQADADKILAAARPAAKKAAPGPASEKKANAAKTGAEAAKLADSYLAAGNAAKAVEFYRLALAKGSVDADKVNTQLGVALAQAGQLPDAQAAFASVKAGPEAEVAALWSAWLANGGGTATASIH